MKVDKENICGLVKAVELFVQRDYDQIMAQWDSYVDTIRAGLSDCPGLEITIGIPTEPGVQPACIRRLFLRPLTMPGCCTASGTDRRRTEHLHLPLSGSDRDQPAVPAGI